MHRITMTKNDNENTNKKTDHAKLRFTWSVLKYGKNRMLSNQLHMLDVCVFLTVTAS